jgi:hypothetical protein
LEKSGLAFLMGGSFEKTGIESTKKAALQKNR